MRNRPPPAGLSDTHMGRRVYPPPQVLEALEALFGEGVEHVAVIENSMFARLHGRVAATTRLRRIYLRDSALKFFGDPDLILHEYCHVLLQWESGNLTTIGYLIESARHGYWNNRFEVEARRFADDNLPRFLELLKGERSWPG